MMVIDTYMVAHMLNGQILACKAEINKALSRLDDIIDIAHTSGNLWIYTQALYARIALEAAIDILHENDY